MTITAVIFACYFTLADPRPATDATFVLNGKISCQIEIHADYSNLAVNIELVNVRKYGTRRHRVQADKFKDVGDDLARYILGVDDDFERFFKT